MKGGLTLAAYHQGNKMETSRGIIPYIRNERRS